MLEKRVKIQSVVESQLPDFLRTDGYKAGDFLKTYYKSTEFQGGPVNILENIDQYTKVGTYSSIVGFTSITSDVDSVDLTINVTSTNGWPDSYGLLKINDEIISYTAKTGTTFTGCIRGFSGITSYRGLSGPDELIFEESSADDHVKDAQVVNLSSLFLREFLKKLKTQFLPGFEDRELHTGINVPNFIRQSKDFYSSKGTENSFEILFKALYGVNARILKPQDNLFIPSNASYKRNKQLVVEAFEGDISDLKTQTVFQEDEYGNTTAFGSVIDVEEIRRTSNKVFHRINLDYDENKDLNVFGSIGGDFRIDPNSKVIGKTSSGSTTLTVESTIGFGTTGTLTVDFDSYNSGIITYASKSVNQFYGCVGVTSIIEDKTTIYQNVSSFGYSPDGDLVRFWVKGSLGDFVTETISSNVPYFQKGDDIFLQSLGISKHSEIADSLLYNTPAKLKVKSIVVSGQNYIVTTFDEHPLQLTQLDCSNQDVCFRIGDSIELIDQDGKVFGGAVISVDSDNQFTCNGFSGIDLTNNFDVRRNIQKISSLSNPSIEQYLADVTASYFDGEDGVYVATNSLPRYANAISVNDGSVTLSGEYTGETINYTDHGFISGEEVHYRPDKYVESVGGYGSGTVAITTTSELGDLVEGVYFVKKVDDNNFKLSQSRGDIFQDKYVSIAGVASAQIIKPILSYENTLDATKQLSYFPPFPTGASEVHPVEPGMVGMFVNGVNIQSYKSGDYVYWGEIQKISVVDSGTDYDVVNPPRVIVTDAIGSGATATATVSGVLEKIDVVDPGSDFITDPIVNITGGNGKGASAKANLKYKKISNVVNTSAGGKFISTSYNVIGFTSYHKFRDGDAVVYDTNENTPLGIGSTSGSQIVDANLANKSTYFVGVVGLTSITLHNKAQDALAGINTINITGFGTGNQYFTTVNSKAFLASVSVVTAGKGYRNNQVRVVPNGISTAADTINYTDHGFDDGDLVNYRFSGTSISGLTTDQNYYILKENDNSFQLAAAGIGTTISNTNYLNRLAVDLKSEGAGTHDFNYPSISVTVSGVVGIATTNVNIFEPVVQPYFRGSIEKINLVERGVGYGSSNIINFERQSLITFENGEDAQTKTIISNGVIKEVLVVNGGTGYEAPPTLKISGSGTKASLTPVITNGSLTAVKINDGGVGYTTATTFVEVIPSGKGASVRTNIRSWEINRFEKEKSKIGQDDGVLAKSLNQESAGTFASLNAPRSLRRKTYSKNNDGSKRYGTFDLVTINGIEQPSSFHSPIIGWAFDGHPIYGPYGYDTPSGGPVRAMKPGYEVSTSDQRPDTYNAGFFVEDYIFTGDGDLDERNGRFCKTPDYPNGIYAYFATINAEFVESAGPFKNYKIPVFPYVLGRYYKSQPATFNFVRQNNQVQFDFVDSDLLRNTKPIKINSAYGSNDYLDSTLTDPNQRGKITETQKGGIYAFEVVSAGTSYKSGEYIDLDAPSPTFGQRTIARVGEIKGKKIVSFASSSISSENVEFLVNGGLAIGYCTTPHNFNNKIFAEISGLSTNAYQGVEGSVKINNSIRDQKTWYLETELSDPSVTGLTTNIAFIGPYDPLYVRENTIIGIGSTDQSNLEQLLVLNVDPLNNRMRVQRQYNGTTGTGYSSRTLALQLPSYVNFPVGLNTYTTTPPTFERYFNAPEVVGLGTTASVGIGTTITYQRFNNIAPPSKLENNNYEVGVGITSRLIPIKTIWIPNHSFETGDKLVYSNGGGTSIQVSNGSTFTLSDGSTVYAIKESDNLLGISTTKVGVGSTGSFVGLGSTAVQLSFTSAGVGVTHSFKLSSSPLTGNIKIHEGTLSTEEPHGLDFTDRIAITATPGFTTDIFVQYNDFNRRMVFNRRKFTSSDVNTTTNTITLSNHNLATAQKVVFTTTATAPTGLDNNGMYYVIRIDENNFKLASNLRDSNGRFPIPVRISAGGSGEHFVSKINPPINAVLGTKIGFALTDSSLSYTKGGPKFPAFDLKFYRDINLNDEFVTSGKSITFEVTGVGTVGVTTTAVKHLSITDFTPHTLYYKFGPINVDECPVDKAGIVIDKDQYRYNKITVEKSTYSATTYATGIGSTTFTYLLNGEPEKVSYAATDGNFSYVTDSIKATGPIHSIDVIDRGNGYEALPGITSIKTEKGSGAILRPIGDMGCIEKVKLQDVGYNYPSDPTLKVFANVPEILILEELCSFGEIGITSGGRHYLVPPNFVVKDGDTGNIIDDVILKAHLENGSIEKMEVLQNTKSLSDVQPVIIPINNSNGVGITTVGFNTITNEVDVIFDVGFSTAGSFPFNVGDKVYVENIGIASTGSGYNSDDYDYKFFEITATEENIGGIGSVTYKLDSSVTNPGLYVTTRSYGRMIPPQDQPIFDSELITNNFAVGETVISTPSPTNQGGGIKGTVSTWDPTSKVIKINSKNEFEKDTIINGKSTLSKAKISQKYDVDAYFDITGAPIVVEGWSGNSGMLDDSTQRLIDSDYYQYFSYSIQSQIAYETWNEVVISLNHTSGFKKFSDLLVDSQASRNLSPGISTTSGVDVNINLYSLVSTYCHHDFDFITTKSLTIGGKTFGKSSVFENRSLTDYEESIGNRVLSIDDFSLEFNSDPRPTKHSIVDTFTLSDTRFRRYVISCNDTQFTDEVQTSIIELLIDDDGNGYIQEYSDVDTGLNAYFDFQAKGTEGQLLFYPTKFKLNNYDIHGLAQNTTRTNFSSVGLSTQVGIVTVADIAYIQEKGTTINAGVTTAVNILGFSTATYHSSKFTIVTDQDHQHETVNLTLLQDGTDVIGVEYGRMNNNDNTTTAGSGLGTYGATISNDVVYLNFTPTQPSSTGAGITFNIMQTSFNSGVSTLGIGTTQLVNGNFVAGFTTITASGSPGITTIAKWTSSEDGAYVYVEVEDVTNNDFQVTEIVASSNSNAQVMTEYGTLDTNGSGIGTFGIEYIDNESHLRFTPIASVKTHVKSLYQTTKSVGAGTDIVTLLDNSIQCIEGLYTGTETDVKRAFGLKHETEQIFTRNIDASSTSIVDLDLDLIVIPNHYFVSGERLTYTPIGSGTTSNIGIATTSISGISTDKLPSQIYAIKVDDKSIRIAASAEDALVSAAGKYLNLTSVGIGTSHIIQAHNQNSKVVVALNNNIQNPIVSMGMTYTLAADTTYGGETFKLSGITSIFGADLLKLDDEIVKVKSVGIGSTNNILVQRGWMGTGFATHTDGTLLTKYDGAYNIVGNTINFYDAPIGPRPAVVAGDPNAQDWTGIQTHSTFQGRVFMRSGAVGNTTDTYSTNYIFDSISKEFNGIGKTFTLTADNQNVTGFSTANALVLINEIAQGPSGSIQVNDFDLVENAGITSIVWCGYAASITNDVNTGTVPVGGVLVSVGSTTGFGYQPLVAAGATAIVSGFGTVSSLSIGNTGSGYRAGINTLNGVIREVSYEVGIRTNSNTYTAIGTALISGGHVTGFVLDTPYAAGTAYTFTDAPEVIIQDPLSYSDIPLLYNSDSPGVGVGSEASVDIVIGQYSNVIDFNLKGNGYGYNVGEILTVPMGGVAGIPTNNISTTPVVSGGNYAHTFVGAGLNCIEDNTGSTYTPIDATYTPSTGVMQLTFASAHGLTVSNTVKVVGTGITFSCTMDGNTSNKNYPRSGDPVSGIFTSIVGTSSTTININVGASPLVRHPVHHATYNASTGVMELNIGSHSLTAGTSIRLDDESLVFTCERDKHLTKHGYPRPSDPYYQTAINIDSVSAETITINVGVATAGQQYTHRYVGAGVSEFRLNIDKVHDDKFSAWHFGNLDVLDSLAEEFDGETQVFLLKKDRVPVTIKSSDGSGVDVEQVLMVFINNILQEPGAGYKFNGGSQLTFTEAPKKGDTSKILFYKGTSGVDVLTRDILETVKKGDTITINHGDNYDSSYQQNPRVVTGIVTTDTVVTTAYMGPGLTTDTTISRPVTWCRQQQDVVIEGIGIGKDRPLYEPQINPTAWMIKSVGIGSTQIFVDDCRPFFESERENFTAQYSKKKVTFVTQGSRVGASATAVVSLGGTISSIVISDGGVGYSTDPVVTIGNPVGLGTTFRAEANSYGGQTGVITSILISSAGSGYTFTSPPNVLISPPPIVTETDEVEDYNGDSGIIVGFGTTTYLAVDRAIFDFHIPFNSPLRDNAYVGSAQTISGISTGDYFVVRNSNVGMASTSVESRDIANQVIAIGTQFADNVYQVFQYEDVQYDVVGVGTTTLRRVWASITGFSTITWGEPDIYFDSTVYRYDNSGLGTGTNYLGIVTTSNFFGDYSWGRIDVTRDTIDPKAFTFYGNDGVGGISTSALVVRTNPLRSYGYSD